MTQIRYSGSRPRTARHPSSVYGTHISGHAMALPRMARRAGGNTLPSFAENQTAAPPLSLSQLHGKENPLPAPACWRRESAAPHRRRAARTQTENSLYPRLRVSGLWRTVQAAYASHQRRLRALSRMSPSHSAPHGRLSRGKAGHRLGRRLARSTPPMPLLWSGIHGRLPNAENQCLI